MLTDSLLLVMARMLIVLVLSIHVFVCSNMKVAFDRIVGVNAWVR